MSSSTSPDIPGNASIDEAREAREHEVFMRSLDPAIAAAAEWHTRNEDGLSTPEQAQFQQWLGANPAHAAAYAQLDQTYATLHRLPADAANRLRASSAVEPAHAAPASPPSVSAAPALRRRAASRWAWLFPSPVPFAACCSVLVAVGIGWYQWQEWQKQPTFTHHYATQRGQRLDAPLPDGSELTLDAATRTEVALYRDRREVRLAEGQVMFVVAPDASKPFQVLAGQARVTVVGTRFSVRYTTTGAQAGAVEVAVEQGQVRVESARSAPTGGDTQTAMLTAGQAVEVDAAGNVGRITTPPGNGVALWRKGLVRFIDTPLARVIEELERYGPTGLVVTDPAVADLRIGGSFEVAKPGELTRLLPAMLPVKLIPRGDGRKEVVSAR